MLSLGTSSPVQLACIAKVPVQRAFLHSGYAQIGERESKMLHKAGGGGASKGTLACKPLNFKKPIHPQKGLLIGMAWYC